jgi:hypothetical protein
MLAAQAVLSIIFALPTTSFPRVRQLFERQALSSLLRRYQGAETDTTLGASVIERERVRTNLGIFIAARYAALIADTARWRSPEFRRTGLDRLGLPAEEIATRFSPSAEELVQATLALQRLGIPIGPAPRQPPSTTSIVRMALLLGLLPLAVGSVLFGLLFRGGLVAHVMSITFVTRTGALASRARIFFRNLLAWSPLILIAIPRSPLVLAGGLLLLAGILLSIINPQRGLPDRLAGTWMVPK